MTTTPPGFGYTPLFPLGTEATPWRRLDIAGLAIVPCDGTSVLKIAH